MKSERISPFWVNGYQPFSADLIVFSMRLLSISTLLLFTHIESLRNEYVSSMALFKQLLGSIINIIQLFFKFKNQRINLTDTFSYAFFSCVNSAL